MVTVNKLLFLGMVELIVFLVIAVFILGFFLNRERTVKQQNNKASNTQSAIYEGEGEDEPDEGEFVFLDIRRSIVGLEKN